MSDETATRVYSEDMGPAYQLAAAKAVLAERERELLDIKGPCSAKLCRLHRTHSGPCHVRKGTVQ